MSHVRLVEVSVHVGHPIDRLGLGSVREMGNRRGDSDRGGL